MKDRLQKMVPGIKLTGDRADILLKAIRYLPYGGELAMTYAQARRELLRFARDYHQIPLGARKRR